MPVIAWVGIGCGGIIVIGIVLMVFAFGKLKGFVDDFAANPDKAGAEMMVSMNPDLKLVSQDEKTGMMTIRTKDGKEMTLSYKDIAAGKITATNADGSTTTIGSTDLSKVPAWVPKAPDLTDGISTINSDGGGQLSGKSRKGTEDLKTFFETAASAQGLSSTSTTSMNINGKAKATMEYSGGGKSLKIVITEKPGSGTVINTDYSEK